MKEERKKFTGSLIHCSYRYFRLRAKSLRLGTIKEQTISIARAIFSFSFLFSFYCYQHDSRSSSIDSRLQWRTQKKKRGAGRRVAALQMVSRPKVGFFAIELPWYTTIPIALHRYRHTPLSRLRRTCFLRSVATIRASVPPPQTLSSIVHLRSTEQRCERYGARAGCISAPGKSSAPVRCGEC